MPLHLHNTLSRAVEPLAPAAADGVFRLYCCGPTVYGAAHIGNFRTFLVQDVLRRALEIDLGRARVLHARNITDVDDKTIRQSLAEGLPLAEVTARWTSLFHADCAALNLLPPHFEPGAVATIPDQISLIQRLLDLRHAYRAADGSIYFSVASFPGYGRLSRLDATELRSQATTSAGAANDADEYDRESVQDFALWKARKPEDGPNFWPSPFGEGRPGWHIECSAMIEKIFAGQPLDLHGGGVDLIFPHHENEIAQSACAHDHEPSYTLARHWFHSAHLMVDGGKMSKSLKNIYTLEDIRRKFGVHVKLTHDLWGGLPQPNIADIALRYTLISGHYRSPLNFTFHGLTSSQSALQKLDKNLAALDARAHGDKAPAVLANLKSADPANLRWGRYAPAWAVLCDDLNIPGALGEIFKVEPRAATAEQAAEDLEGLVKIAVHALGLELPLPVATVAVPENIAALAQQRWDAKQARDFKTADALRQQLAALGWKILDRKDGFSVESVSN